MLEVAVLLIVVSLLGIVNAGYLTWKHYRKQPLVCPLNERCEIVTESKWAHMFGIRNEVIGIFYYLSALLITIYVFFFNPSVKIFFIFGSGLALLFSIFLIYIQARVIKSFCFYCIISAILSALIFALSFAI